MAQNAAAPNAQPVLRVDSRTPSVSSADSIKKEKDSEKEKHEAPAAQASKDDLLDPVDETPRFRDLLFNRKKFKQYDPDAIATRRSVFDDPVLAKHYQPSARYENRHRFDPNARWTFREEKAIVRKIDWKVILWAMISFSALNLDRGNLSQANTDNILPDLNMTTNDFNLGNTLFRVCFLSAELPSQMVSKRLGPDVWIPIQMCAWSIVTAGQFWLSGRTSFLICRAFLGFIQGGFIPDLILYLSYYYTKTELPLRLAFFWMSADVCTVIASFMAFGILRMRGIHGKEGWRWLFLIEGLFTLSIGIATFFRMPPSPTQTRAWYRPSGWFTEREETIIVSRILRDDPTKGDMHNREGLSPKRLWTAVLDYDLWPMYILGLMFQIPMSPPQTYLTLSLRGLGFGTLETNLLVIPHLVGSFFAMLFITLLSEYVNERSLVSMLQQIWALPCLIAIYTLPANPNQWHYYAIATVFLAYPSVHAMQVGWCSRNSGAVASRTVNASLYNMFVQASSITSANIYRKDDAPRYRRGNRQLLIINCINLFLLYPGTKLYYLWRNKQKERKWSAMTPEEQSQYLETTKDVGNRRLDFRFAH